MGMSMGKDEKASFQSSMAQHARVAPARRTSARQAEQTSRNLRIFRSFLTGVPIKKIADTVGVSTIRVNQIVRRQAALVLPHIGQHLMTAPLAEVRQALGQKKCVSLSRFLPEVDGGTVSREPGVRRQCRVGFYVSAPSARLLCDLFAPILPLV